MPKEKKIEVIEGKTNPNIILVAPHGVKGDDDNAGGIARAIQKKLGCHAVINEVFGKPEKDETGEYGKPDFKKNLADLNYRPHAEKHPTFIKDITGKITDAANTFVFWIHGIDDENLAKEAQKRNYGDAKCLVGYGQGKDNTPSMEPERAKQFVSILTANEMPTKATHAQSADYRGASATNMNQYFNDPANNLAGVQSVQLEFAKEGIRVRGHIAAAGIKVAKSIAALVGCEMLKPVLYKA